MNPAVREEKSLVEMQAGGHYAVAPDSFILTKGGIKKAYELTLGDALLGVEGGRPRFREIANISSQAGERWVRILADSCESLVPTRSSIFTIRGPTAASQIAKDDILEMMNVPSGIMSELEKLPTRVIDARYEIGLTPSLSYLLGTQLFAERFSDRVLVDKTDPSVVRELAGEFKRTLGEWKIPHRIYLPRYGGRLRIDSFRLARLVRGVLGNGYKVPSEIRLSTPEVMRHFVCGVLDSTISEPGHQQGEVRLRTSSMQSECRRFVFQVLRLYGAKSVSSRVYYPQNNMAYVDNYIQSTDLERLGLRFFRIRPKKVIDEDRQVFSYTKVVNVNSFKGRNTILEIPGSGWTVESDLVLLQRLVKM